MSGMASFFGRGGDYKTSLAALPAGEDRPPVVERTEALAYQEWTQTRRQFMIFFVKPRLLIGGGGGDGGDDEDGKEENNQQQQQEKDQQNATAASNDAEAASHIPEELETQQEDVVAVVATTTTSTTAPEETNKEEQEQEGTTTDDIIVIPPVSEAVHPCDFLNDLDLLTKHLTLDFCRAVHTWRFRSIRRCERAIPRPQALYTGTPQFPRLSLDYYQDDGPVLSTYSEVLSMEVVQLNKPTSFARQRADQMQQDGGVRRLAVFFYNRYAKVLNVLRSKTQTRTSKQNNSAKLKCYLSLQKIPAKCVFPHAPADWLDRHDQAQYCLAIGDESTMRVTTADGSTKIRFDNDELRIYVLFTEDLKLGGQVHLLAADNQKGVKTSKVAMEASPFAEYCPKEPQQPAQPTRDTNTDEGARKRQRTDQGEVKTYTPISDFGTVLESHKCLAEGDACIINCYAVVIGFSPPHRTKRDWMMGIGLVDDSTPPNEYSVNINIFAKNKDDLPEIRRAGDVVRMHRVQLKEWNGNMQLMGRRASSYVVCRGKPHEDNSAATEWTYFSTASKKDFSPTESENERFQNLWNWAQQRLLEHATMKLSTSFQLSDIPMASSEYDRPGGDITVMVGSIIPIPPGALPNSPRAILRVWDGTGAPESDPLPFEVESAYAETGDPPTEALVKIASIVTKLNKPGMEPPKALTGRVVNAVIWEDWHWELVQQTLSPGAFIRLRNVQEQCTGNGTTRCLEVQSKSYLTPLPDLTYEVVRILVEHNERLKQKHAFNPLSGILPLENDARATTESSQQPDDSPKVTTTSTIDSSQRSLNDPAQQRQTPPKANTTNDSVRRSLKELVSMARGHDAYPTKVHVVELIPSLRSLTTSGADAILGSSGEFRFGARLRDQSGTYDVILDPSVAEALVGMPADSVRTNFKEVLNNLGNNVCGAWDATIRSCTYLGATYLVAESLHKS